MLIENILMFLMLMMCVLFKFINGKPNIVMIIADDMGWNDVGFHGSNEIPTPNIDALAYNGVILNRFYALPTCTPSRSALLTGTYPIKLGMQGTPLKAGENRAVPINTPTIAVKLKELGYATHLVGKWHLGSAYRNVTPTRRGFDSHFGYWNGYIGYFDHQITQNNMTGYDMHENLDPIFLQDVYATDLFTTKATELIKNRNTSQPLFVVVSHLAVHAGKNGSDMEVPNINKTNQEFEYISDENRRLYAGVVKSLDDSVGQIVTTLLNEHILNETIIVFFSDNGAQTIGMHQNYGSNWPLRGLKFTMYEGGIRTVAAAYSSLFVNRRISNELFHITDWFPTLYEAAGGNVEDLEPLDGVSQWKTLISIENSNRTDVLLNIDEAYNTSGIIVGQYKLLNGSFQDRIYDQYYGNDGRNYTNLPPYNITTIIQSETNTALDSNLTLTTDIILGLRSRLDLKNCRNASAEILCDPICLFDLNNDPCETKNIASQFPETVADLSRNLGNYWTKLIPQTNGPVESRANPAFCYNSWFTWVDGCYSNSILEI